MEVVLCGAIYSTWDIVIMKRSNFFRRVIAPPWQNCVGPSSAESHATCGSNLHMLIFSKVLRLAIFSEQKSMLRYCYRSSLLVRPSLFVRWIGVWIALFKSRLYYKAVEYRYFNPPLPPSPSPPLPLPFKLTWVGLHTHSKLLREKSPLLQSCWIPLFKLICVSMVFFKSTPDGPD